jgi:uncharacterized membrane protein
LILGAIAYAVTGNWRETGGITVFFHGIRLVLYYWHERLWDRFSWGRLRHPLQSLPVRKDLSPEDYRVIKRLLDEHKYSADEPEYQI